MVSNLGNEARAAQRKKQKARESKAALIRETLLFKIKRLKATSDEKFGDRFNFLVCTKLDELESEGLVFLQGQSRLAIAQKIVEGQLEEEIGDSDLENYLTDKIRGQEKKKLAKLLESGCEFLGNEEKAICFTAVMFEIKERQTDAIWQERKLREIIAAGLNGEEINLISVLCCINQFDQSNYTLVPNLQAFQDNPKLEPVPLILNELIQVKKLLESQEIKVKLTIYVADTDYTEIGQFGEVTKANLENLETYLDNLNAFLNQRDPETQILPISQLTDGNPLYEEVRLRVLEKVIGFKDQDFTQRWYKKFETAVERVTESQGKRKLFSSRNLRKKALEITRRIWAVNAAQGAIFAQLSKNTILISTERRERDQNYVIDKKTGDIFPPVLYILRAAENWNRKLKEQMIR